MAYNPRRIEMLRAALREHGLSALYVRSLSNIAWITGFERVFDSEPAHALILDDTQALLHSDMRYAEALEERAQGSAIKVDATRESHACLLQRAVEENLDLDTVSSADKPEIVIGIENSISLAEFRTLEARFLTDELPYHVTFVEFSDFVERLREVKDDAEVAAMKKAQSITDAAFARILDYMQPGMTEREVQLQLDRFMFEEGAEGLAFDTIVATGAHASSPHAIPGGTCLQLGDAVVMDFGARYAGYRSDMTRTVFVGQPNDKLLHAWETLCRVNETCERTLCAGVTGAEIHNRAESLLAEAGYKDRMGHSLGHSVGLDIHEGPNLAPSNTRPLESGNVVTVEPGIYIPGEFGMRLEDFGVVTSDGYDVFTKTPHKMFIIDKLN